LANCAWSACRIHMLKPVLRLAENEGGRAEQRLAHLAKGCCQVAPFRDIFIAAVDSAESAGRALRLRPAEIARSEWVRYSCFNAALGSSANARRTGIVAASADAASNTATAAAYEAASKRPSP
jgi:hypothetical protein